MTTETKIKKNIFEAIEKIKEKCKPEKIILFGSYSYGTFTRDSDIDILIIKNADKKNRIDRFVEIKRIIYNPKFKTPISPIVITKNELQRRLNMGDDFIKEITSKGEVLYER